MEKEVSHAKITFHVVTLFPEAFKSYLGSSIIGRATREKHIAVKFYNPRDFITRPAKKHSNVLQNIRMSGKKKKTWFYRQVDDKPYGGGPGMVLQAEPFLKAVEKALRSKLYAQSSKIYFFDRSGKQFTNADARSLAKKSRNIVLIAGHYEGIDARVQKILKAKKISVGSYTLTGGELPAMAVIDAVSRQIKGVLGTFESVEEERVSSSEVYTRPEVFIWHGKKYRVPKVLLSGHHAKIDNWKQRKGLKPKTEKRKA